MSLADIKVGDQVVVKDKYSYYFGKKGAVSSIDDKVIGKSVGIQNTNGESFRVDLLQIKLQPNMTELRGARSASKRSEP